MPDGERVTTGSEPRQYVVLVDKADGGAWILHEPKNIASWRAHLNRMMDSAHELIEVQEVVEPGHDEQTRCADCGKPITPARAEDSSYQHGPWFCEACFAARSEWRPDPRTVAAVVEFLRSRDPSAGGWGATMADAVAEEFRK